MQYGANCSGLKQLENSLIAGANVSELKEGRRRKQRVLPPSMLQENGYQLS
jgi:hypothetical protein